jgi:hypothetical protein
MNYTIKDKITGRVSDMHHPFCAYTYRQSKINNKYWLCNCDLFRQYDEWRLTEGLTIKDEDIKCK